MRALVIEDDPTFRAMVGESFKDDGFAIVAHDGETGVRLASELAVDVVIVDLGLPGMSGLEVIRTLRRVGHAFPILVLSARQDQASRIEALEAGADAYMSKPFRYEELVTRAKTLADGRNAAR